MCDEEDETRMGDEDDETCDVEDSGSDILSVVCLWRLSSSIWASRACNPYFCLGLSFL